VSNKAARVERRKAERQVIKDIQAIIANPRTKRGERRKAERALQKILSEQQMMKARHIAGLDK
jgi:hypothetical protein